ncbi:MAG: VWA domain-containing protein [Bacilli bacterium]|nr:VWA domain-containing protein [Bacilli bacterium]
MKSKRKFILGTSLLLLLAGCGGGNNFGDSAPTDMDRGYDIGSRGESASSDYSSSPSDESYNGEPSNNIQATISAGLLTCSAVDDNKEYDFWKELASVNQSNEKNQFKDYKDKYAFDTYNRLELNILNGNNIKVKIKDTDYETYVDNFHKAYLFPKTSDYKEEYDVEISYVDSANENQTVTKTVKTGNTIDLEQTFTISDYMQIMFVIDATGSMGDEIKYLQAEIDDVITKVKASNETARIELSIMMYRDFGDEYVVKYNEFTTDIASQKEFLANQKAAGGDDFEEAVDEALMQAAEKQWSNYATKLLFFVADAPAHDTLVGNWNNAVNNLAKQGIKIITVASSGIDSKTEYFFRSQCLLTGGQYVYLTNNSGIGGEHLEATTKEKLPIEFLNSCLIRLINGYYTGVMENPIPYKQDQQHVQ